MEASFLDMLGVLPVIFFAAAIPTPMRAAAITIWVVLFPDNEAQLSAFGLVMHNFFIFFNAAIGLLFLRRAKPGAGAGLTPYGPSYGLVWNKFQATKSNADSGGQFEGGAPSLRGTTSNERSERGRPALDGVKHGTCMLRPAPSYRG